MRYFTNTAPCGDDIHVHGNGKMLVYGKGLLISGISGMPYTSDIVCGLDISNSGDIYGISCREESANIWYHKLAEQAGVIPEKFETLQSYASFCDFLDVSRCVFVRSFTSIKNINFKLLLPPHIQASYMDVANEPGDYTNYDKSLLLSFTGQQGIILNSGSPKEKHLLIMLSGSAHFSYPTNEICIRNGSGTIVFSMGYPSEAFKNASFVLNHAQMCQENVRKYWKNYLTNTGKLGLAQNRLAMGDTVQKTLAEALVSVLITVKCHCSLYGGIISGQAMPFVSIPEQYFLLNFLLDCNKKREAANILKFIRSRFELFGEVAYYEGTGHIYKREGSCNEGAEVPAYIILSAAQYYHVSRDAALFSSLLPLLTWAAGKILDYTYDNMALWNGNEHDILYGHLPPNLILQGCARNTLLNMAALRCLVKITEQAGLSLKNTEQYWRAYRRYTAAFAGHFITGEQRLCANAEIRPSIMHRRKFKYAICNVCGDMTYPKVNKWLERQRDGSYLCPDCIIHRMNSSEDKTFLPYEAANQNKYNGKSPAPGFTRYFLTQDILIACYLSSMTGFKLLSEDVIKSSLRFCEMEQRHDGHANPDFITLRALELYYTADCGEQEKAEMQLQYLSERTDGVNLWAELERTDALTEKKYPSGKRAHPLTNAICACSVINYSEKFYKNK